LRKNIFKINCRAFSRTSNSKNEDTSSEDYLRETAEHEKTRKALEEEKQKHEEERKQTEKLQKRIKDLKSAHNNAIASNNATLKQLEEEKGNAQLSREAVLKLEDQMRHLHARLIQKESANEKTRSSQSLRGLLNLRKSDSKEPKLTTAGISTTNTTTTPSTTNGNYTTTTNGGVSLPESSSSSSYSSHVPTNGTTTPATRDSRSRTNSISNQAPGTPGNRRVSVISSPKKEESPEAILDPVSRD
jgi:hypothetical protein